MAVIQRCSFGSTAVLQLRKIQSLNYKVTERNAAQAVGLLTFCRKFRFFASLLLFSDVLPPLAKLLKLFQKKDRLVDGTKAAIEALKDSRGMHLSQHSATLEQYKELGVHKPSECDEVTFREQIELPFLENVLRNLDEQFPHTGLIATFDIFSGVALIEEDQLQEADMAKMELLSEQFSNVVVSTDLHSDWKAWRSSVLHGLSKDAVEKLMDTI